MSRALTVVSAVLALVTSVASAVFTQPEGAAPTDNRPATTETTPVQDLAPTLDTLAPAQITAVPAARRAENVAVITIRGPIDTMTSISVRRRIAEAEASGADAMVFDIDSPGGEVGAVLEITNAIKGSPISNSVAWVNPNAYSGGAIIAFACRRLIVNDPASIGDALAILVSPLTGVQRVPQELRAKFIPPVVAELTDSARRYGYDEYLMQAVASDGIELWLVERTDGEPVRHAIDENEYREIFQSDPPRGKPLLGTVPGDTRARAPQSAPPGTDADADPGPDANNTATDDGTPDETTPDQRSEDLDPGSGSEGDILAEEQSEAARFRPAGTALADIQDEISGGLEIESERPIFDASQRGKWRLVAYVSDGSGAIVMRGDQLASLGFQADLVENDQDLRDYFGATNIVRLDESWSEKLVRWMTNPIVRGVLIVILLLGLFLEMISPGLIAPGAVALVAFAALIIPPMIVGLAGWWEVVAILGGLALIAFEIFVTPGFGFFGIAGLLALFAGLVGTFVPSGSGGGLFPNSPGASEDLLFGSVTVLLAIVTAGVGAFFIMRHMGSVPVFNRLVLTSSRDHEDRGTLIQTITAMRGPVAEGDIGMAMTDLRPVGKAEFGDEVVEVTAESGYLDAGGRVRVVRVESFRIVVDAAEDPVGDDAPRDLDNLDDAQEFLT